MCKFIKCVNCVLVDTFYLNILIILRCLYRIFYNGFIPPYVSFMIIITTCQYNNIKNKNSTRIQPFTFSMFIHIVLFGKFFSLLFLLSSTSPLLEKILMKNHTVSKYNIVREKKCLFFLFFFYFSLLWIDRYESVSFRELLSFMRQWNADIYKSTIRLRISFLCFVLCLWKCQIMRIMFNIKI